MPDVRLAHPSPEQLTAFALGRLTPAEHARIERHVSECSTCCHALLTVPNDTFVERLRVANTPPTDPPPPAAKKPPPVPVPPELARHSRYRIVKSLGAGGMGTVFQAEHRLMARAVALKVINPALIGNPAAVERFRLEVKAAAQLAHPNIVTAYDAEQAGSLHFLVMEYVEGTSLARHVEERGPLPVAQACALVRQAALGLQHAYEQGMVHRDIKPHNLMLTAKGDVKILDFGLARLARDGPSPNASGLTATGTVLGTPDFIAPEQAKNSRQADIRSDIYSLGCTLYYLLVGRVPFPDGSAMEKLFAHVESAPRPVSETRRDLPPALVQVVKRMMAKDPAQRYQTPAEVAQALAPFCDGHSASAAQPASRRRLVLAAVAAALFLATGVGVLGLSGVFSNRPESKSEGPNPPARPTVPDRSPQVLLVLASKDFSFDEYNGVRQVLNDAKVRFQVASTALEPATADALAGGGPPVKPHLLLEKADFSKYDAVVFCGGRGVGEFFGHRSGGPVAGKLIREMLSDRRCVAAIGMGPTILADLEVLKGKQATCLANANARQKLQNHGAILKDAAVVTIGQIITGRDAQSAPEFTRELLRCVNARR